MRIRIAGVAVAAALVTLTQPPAPAAALPSGWDSDPNTGLSPFDGAPTESLQQAAMIQFFAVLAGSRPRTRPRTNPQPS